MCLFGVRLADTRRRFAPRVKRTSGVNEPTEYTDKLCRINYTKRMTKYNFGTVACVYFIRGARFARRINAATTTKFDRTNFTQIYNKIV